jgi:hypothetical protein
MELRLLEAIWSLERGVLDQMETLRKIRESIEAIKGYLLRYGLDHTTSVNE